MTYKKMCPKEVEFSEAAPDDASSKYKKHDQPEHVVTFIEQYIDYLTKLKPAAPPMLIKIRMPCSDDDEPEIVFEIDEEMEVKKNELEETSENDIASNFKPTAAKIECEMPALVECRSKTPLKIVEKMDVSEIETDESLLMNIDMNFDNNEILDNDATTVEIEDAIMNMPQAVRVRYAVKAVESGIMNLSEAISKYKVPKSTVHDHLTGKVHKFGRGRNRVLTDEQERIVAEELRRRRSEWRRESRSVLLEVATRIVVQQRLNNLLSPKTALVGRKWLTSFMERHEGTIYS